MTSKILVFGEIIWDVYPDKKHIGGAGLNFAAHCTKCGCESYILSAVGHDELGEQAIKSAKDFGVITEFTKITDLKSGQCIVTLDEKAIPSYNVLRGVAYDNIVLDENDIAAVKQKKFDALYFGTLIQRSKTSRDTLHFLVNNCDFREKICDVNLREGCFDSDSVKFCLENATILKISDEEEPTLRSFGLYAPKDNSAEGIARAICERFAQIKHVIITCGGKGAYIYCASKLHGFFKESQKVQVASTVGAGDSFLAAWTSAYLSGSSPEEATDRAIRLSAFVVSHIDAIPSYHFKENVLYE